MLLSKKLLKRDLSIIIHRILKAFIILPDQIKPITKLDFLVKGNGPLNKGVLLCYRLRGWES